MALIAPRVTAGLPAEDAQNLRYALSGSHDITVFVDGTVHRLPPEARDAVVDLLNRFSRGEAVTVSSVEEVLTTSQAAELAGISHTYLRNMTDRGEIPVEYRGTHRRIRLADIMAWLETQKKNAPADSATAGAGASATAGAGAPAAARGNDGGNDGGTDGS